MTPRQILNQCITLEAQIDSVLFRQREPDGDEAKGSVLGAAAKVGTVAYAGNAAYRGLKPMVSDRLGGLRMTEPMAARGIGQKLRAVAGAVKDQPLGALKAVGSTVASDARGAGSAIAGLFRKAKGVMHHSALRRDVIEFAEGLTIGDHVLRHYGGPLGVASTSRKGKRWDAFKDSTGEMVKRTAHDTAVGAGLGAAGGLAIGALHKQKIGQAMLRRGANNISHIPGKVAGAGALVGAAGGLVIGKMRGTHGHRQRDIQRQYK